MTFVKRGAWDWFIGDLKTAEVTLNYQEEEVNLDFQPSLVAQGSQIELIGSLQYQRQMLTHLQDYVITPDNTFLKKICTIMY